MYKMKDYLIAAVLKGHQDGRSASDRYYDHNVIDRALHFLCTVKAYRAYEEVISVLKGCGVKSRSWINEECLRKLTGRKRTIQDKL